MKQLHYLSGIIISIFISLHLFNHLYSIHSITSHIVLMDSLRVYYRNIFVEGLLFSAISFQIFSGIKLFLKKRKTVKSFFEKIQIYTGLYLALFFLIHVSAVLSGRYILNLDTNIYFGAAGLNTFPFNLFFMPYYCLAMISFFGHIAAIHSFKMKKDILGINPTKQSYIIILIGCIITLLILYGLTNKFTGIQIPDEYHTLIGT